MLRPPIPGTQRYKYPRPALWIHLGTLGLALVYLVIAGRGHWFYYDEWAFLVPRNQWQLLDSHNGHLSLIPRLTTTILRLSVGVNNYWPYLALTFAAHLGLAHVLWRLMVRSRVSPFIATLLAALFTVLAGGYENIFWAFQYSYILPLLLGGCALLILLRAPIRVRDMVIVGLLMTLALGSSGTSLAIVPAVFLVFWMRHGFKRAFLSFVVPCALYATWYLTLNLGSSASNIYGAKTLADFFLRVPEYVAGGFTGSLGLFLTLPKTGKAAFVVIGFVGLVVAAAAAVVLFRFVRKHGWPQLLIIVGLIPASLLFALLTAFTRVGAGISSSSASRYVYVYVALLYVPLLALALNWLLPRGIVMRYLVPSALVVLIVLNARTLYVQARTDATTESAIPREFSAALSLGSAADAVSPRPPAAVLAPDASLNDLRELVNLKEFSPVPFTQSDLLDVDLNVLTEVTATLSPVPAACASNGNSGYTDLDPRVSAIYSTESINLRAAAVGGGATGLGYAIVGVRPGKNVVAPPATITRLRVQLDSRTCIAPIAQ